jgi:hypothetical protein
VKCIHCAHDCKHSERPDGRCPSCKHPFAFEPRNGDPVTDGVFLAAIEAVSGHRTLRFDRDHVYYEVCRRLRTRRYVPIGIILVLGTFFSALAIFNLESIWRWLIPIGLFAAGLVIAFSIAGSNVVAMDRARFNALWDRWCRTHGAPTGLIVRKETRSQPQDLEPDLGDYSFDRAVICDKPATVDLLLANQFHFENNCAVLSIDGYPPGPFALVRQMLQRNPHLQVFVLHDATPDGCRLAHKLATDPAWFAGRAQVIDVGLRPAHADALKGMWREVSRTVQAGDGITAKEAQWLSSYSLELAAVRPEQVLKRLFRAINRRFDPNAEAKAASSSDGGTSGVGIADDSMGSDAGDMDGGADAFG